MPFNQQLSDFCRVNDTIRAIKMLSVFSELNVLYEEGRIFRFSISKNNLEIFSALLKYFYEVQLPQEENEYNRISQINKLKEFIREAFEMYSPSDEMHKVIELYSINISGEDTGSVKSEIEDVTLIQKKIRDMKEGQHNSFFNEEHLSTKDNPIREESDFIFDRQYEETSDWKINQLKNGLISNKHEDTINTSGDLDSTDHHSD